MRSVVSAHHPVVSILTVCQGSDPQLPFAAQSSMLAGFTRHGRELGMSVYVVTPEGVRSGGLSGWLFNGKRWLKRRQLPIPDVIYDRVPTRTMECKPAVQKAKAFFRRCRGTRYFGMDFFDKWLVHGAWSNDRRVAQHIPKTVDYRGVESVLAMLRAHPVVYVKPRSSSLGLGIVRITGSAEGPWRLSWRDSRGRRHDRSIGSLILLDRTIRQLTRGRPYLVQQGIKMAAYRGRLFDIRAAVQRDQRGAWQISGIGVRLGFAKSIVTNMAAGAVARPLRPIVSEVARSLGTSADQLTNQLRDVALAAAEVLGDAFGDALGEVGLDLAIAQDGTVWLFEANSKPLRTIFQEFNAQMAEECLHKPMEYAHYLAFSSPPKRTNRVGKRGEIK